MKNTIFYLVVTVILLAACDDGYEKGSVTNLTMSETTVMLLLGETTVISAKVEPAGASDVVWSSSDEQVATVDQFGGITAVGQGMATIVATTTIGRKVATCAVYVNPVRVSRITLDKIALFLVNGDKETLTATVFPANATNKNIIWTSSDKDVAIVDQSGEVTAVGWGNVTITATTQDGDFTALSLVTVSKISVTGIALSQNKFEGYYGESVTIIASIIPDNATFPEVIWSSSDEDVATVSKDGLVTIVSDVAGSTAVIKAVSEDNPAIFAECAVEVLPETPEERVYRFFHGGTYGPKTWTWDREATAHGQVGWLRWNGTSTWWWPVTHDILPAQITANEAGATMTFEAPNKMTKTLANGTVYEGTFEIDFTRTFDGYALGTLLITGGDEQLTIPSRASWNGNPKEIPIVRLNLTTMSLITHPNGLAGTAGSTGYGYMFRVVKE